MYLGAPLSTDKSERSAVHGTGGIGVEFFVIGGARGAVLLSSATSEFDLEVALSQAGETIARATNSGHFARVKLTRWRDLPDGGDSPNDGQVWTNKTALKTVSLYRGL
jgi:hypothetical protein